MIKDKLIVALDFPNVLEASEMVTTLNDEVEFYKIGLELFTAPQSSEFITTLRNLDKKIFIDLKMFDIPNTVSRAIHNLERYEPEFITIHACNEKVIEAAVEATKDNDIKVLGVTVLTSELSNGIEDNLVCTRAVTLYNKGGDGVIASGHDIKDIRKKCTDNFIIVCPGIRSEFDDKNDQKRSISPCGAIRNGADYIVVGRPITQATDPLLAATNIQIEINRGLK